MKEENNQEYEKQDIEYDVDDFLIENQEELTKEIVEKSFGKLNEEECSRLFRIIKINSEYGNCESKKELEKYIRSLFKEFNSGVDIMKYAFIFGFMNGQGVLTQEESEDYNKEMIEHLK